MYPSLRLLTRTTLVSLIGVVTPILPSTAEPSSMPVLATVRSEPASSAESIAEPSWSRLGELLAGHRGSDSFTADFEQVLTSPILAKPAVSRGHFSKHRRQLVWETLSPTPALLTLNEIEARYTDPATGESETYPITRHAGRDALWRLDPHALQLISELSALEESRDFITLTLTPRSDTREAVEAFGFASLTVRIDRLKRCIDRLTWIESDDTRVDLRLFNIIDGADPSQAIDTGRVDDASADDPS